MEYKTSVTLKRADKGIQAASERLKTVQTEEQHRQIYTQLTAFAKMGFGGLNSEESPYKRMAREQLE